MTAVAPAALGARAAEAPSIGLDPCLAVLDRAIEAGRSLGIAVDEAAAVRADAAGRLGFPSDAYVVALVGGTGVGKSSLLNALAGGEVSAASVRRPTTSRPVAWLPAARRAELADLLDWLGVAADDVRATARDRLRDVAVLDLPDLDSTALEHRRRVEAILPRVDAVIWVTDPEKYGDTVLHDDFLATWVPRLERQVVVVNKRDRLTGSEADAVRRDLGRDLGRLTSANTPTIILASAQEPDGAAELRRWLEQHVEAKAVVRGRLIARIRDAVRALAIAGGLDPDAPGDTARPLIAAGERRRALERSTAALLRVVDLERLERQAVAATRARARARGAGPLRGLTSLIYRWSGRQAQVADPVSFLARWRERGSLGPAVEPIRGALAEPLRTAAGGTRRRLASGTEPATIERDLGHAVDRAVATRGGDVPSSRVWPAIGVLQTAATLLLVVTAIWVVLWVLVRFPVDSIAVPVVGRVPSPLVALIGVLAAGYLIARLLGLHAGWVGRRWAGRLAADVRANVERDVAATAFASVDAVDSDRAALAAAAGAIGRECGGT